MSPPSIINTYCDWKDWKGHFLDAKNTAKSQNLQLTGQGAVGFQRSNLLFQGRWKLEGEKKKGKGSQWPWHPVCDAVVACLYRTQEKATIPESCDCWGTSGPVSSITTHSEGTEPGWTVTSLKCCQEVTFCPQWTRRKTVIWKSCSCFMQGHTNITTHFTKRRKMQN